MSPDREKLMTYIRHVSRLCLAALYGMLSVAVWLASATNVNAAKLPTDSAWTFHAADCEWQITRHQRRTARGNAAAEEFFDLKAGIGTHIHFIQQVSPARIIEDLAVRVALRSNRRGLQVYGRVVFPESIDPETGKPHFVLVPGQQYERVGQTERLTLLKLPLMLQRQLRVLRTQVEQPIDTRHAYLDALIVNVFGGPGRTEVWLGEISQEGIVEPPLDAQATIQQVAYDTHSSVDERPPQRRSNRLMIDGRPFFPRVIEHRGEPMALLGEIGFNTVYLDHYPSVEEERAAEQASLWIICPPPPAETDWSHESRRILGWYAGESFNDRQHVPGYLDAIRRNDPLGRPIIAHVEEDQWRISRQLDVVLRLREPLGTSFELSHFRRWLQESTYLVRPDTPFWTGIQTELSAALIEQVRGSLGHVANVPPNVQFEQIRQLSLAALSAGSRGLWFRSRSRLDGEDDVALLRRLMLELINHELSLIEPWCMGGQALGLVEGRNPELQVVSLATERSRLLIPTCVQPSAQFVCRPVAGDNRLIIPGVPDSTDAFVLNHLGLSPLPRQRISGGLQLELDASAADSLLLLTEDPLVVTHINRNVASRKRRVVELEQQIAELLLADFETQAARRLLATHSRVEMWEAARSWLRESVELSRVNDTSSAYQFAHYARREIGRLQADVWDEAVAGHGGTLTLPTSASFNLATMVSPDAPQLGTGNDWSDNMLRGGECENLSLMIDSGWRQFQTSPSDVTTYIALSPDRPHGGDFSLRLRATGLTKQAERSVVESGPVWVNTAPVTVQAGQQVRIEGWIRVDEPIVGSLDGCMIIDSLSGESLALRRLKTSGWEHFEILRSATHDDHLTVTIALFGLGEAWVDDLQVSLADQDAGR
ncbi:MAG: hypothetical protein KDA92_09015 [Planctomycetales bacterium]|nr:hypothetical protein [Planctomycetales bacterium]